VGSPGPSPLKPALRASLLEAARGLVRDSEGRDGRSRRDAPARRRVVAAADEYLRAHLARPIYTEELCGALGISPSSLATAFGATFGVSPHRFLKLRRLAMVRNLLRSREGPAPLVKSVALAHGFWHLGLFAIDYRAMYGEMPSETLARIRGARVVRG
jgi:AraC family transcriptional regulator, ethanolamine operon transcriptional activator